MQNLYFISEDKCLKRALDITYDEIFLILKSRNPNSEQLIDDEELSKLHDLYSLLKVGQIDITYNVETGIRTLKVH